MIFRHPSTASAVPASSRVSEKDVRRVTPPTVWVESSPRKDVLIGTFSGFERMILPAASTLPCRKRSASRMIIAPSSASGLPRNVSGTGMTPSGARRDSASSRSIICSSALMSRIICIRRSAKRLNHRCSFADVSSLESIWQSARLPSALKDRLRVSASLKMRRTPRSSAACLVLSIAMSAPGTSSCIRSVGSRAVRVRTSSSSPFSLWS